MDISGIPGRVTRKPTYTATGVKTFTCTVCKALKNPGSIAKLATTDISKNTSKITVSGIENKIYNGKVHTQKSLVVKAGAKTLRLNKDYTVTYSKNKAVGNASVIIRGKNAYSGKITKTFAIVKGCQGKDIYSWKIQIHYNRSKDRRHRNSCNCRYNVLKVR